ncbi:site-specific recombinase [Streptococcus pyogenes]|nr:site-specific recombinase [Streptococcus pyogenes]
MQKTSVKGPIKQNKVKNKGELPQYYVENNHKAIVDKETFDAVQAVLDRTEKGKDSTTLFCSKLVCGDCGHYFGSKVWHSTSKYRRVIYQCNEKYKGEKKCTTPHVTENEIKDWFVSVINKVISNKDEIIQNLEMLLDVGKSSDLERRLVELETEVEVVTQMVSNLVKENAIMPQNQDIYQKKYSNLVERHDALVSEIESIEKQLLEVTRRQKDLKEFLETLNQQSELISEFDELLWETVVDKVEICQNRIVTFTLKNGSEVVA